MAQKGLTVGRPGSTIGNDKVGAAYRPATTTYDASTMSANVTLRATTPSLIVPGGALAVAVSLSTAGVKIRVSADPLTCAVTLQSAGVKHSLSANVLSYAVTLTSGGVTYIATADTFDFLVTLPDAEATITGGQQRRGGNFFRSPARIETPRQDYYDFEMDMIIAICAAVAAEEEQWAA